MEILHFFYSKRASSPAGNEVETKKLEIVLPMVILGFGYPSPQLHQSLKPMRELFCTGYPKRGRITFVESTPYWLPQASTITHSLTSLHFTSLHNKRRAPKIRCWNWRACPPFSLFTRFAFFLRRAFFITPSIWFTPFFSLFPFFLGRELFFLPSLTPCFFHPIFFCVRPPSIDIFSQKESFLENELICLRGSGGTDIDPLDLDDYSLHSISFYIFLLS